MSAEPLRYCWEIMQCEEEDGCPIRVNKIERCWEWMHQHHQFQSQYDLCAECIVYLCRNANKILSPDEAEQILARRGLLRHVPTTPYSPPTCEKEAA